MTTDFIKIRGARQHNLKNISLDIPRNKLVVITGLSGSGKSSLAFDTIYAEGQRRYVESLSAYARQFLEQMDKPDVDSIEGLSPAISIEQRAASKNPRSTVGTVTEIYDYLRVLFARIGQAPLPEVRPGDQFPDHPEIVDQVMALPEGTRIQILAPLVDSERESTPNSFRDSGRTGSPGSKSTERPCSWRMTSPLTRTKSTTISVVVDRLVVNRESASPHRFRGTDPVCLADGQALGCRRVRGRFFSARKRPAGRCGLSLPELTPQMFSFNNPQGACHECSGLGTKRYFDPELIVPDPTFRSERAPLRPGQTVIPFIFSRCWSPCASITMWIFTPLTRIFPRRFRRSFFMVPGMKRSSSILKATITVNTISGPLRALSRTWKDGIDETDSYQVREEIEKLHERAALPVVQRCQTESRSAWPSGWEERPSIEITALSIEKADDFFTRAAAGPKEKSHRPKGSQRDPGPARVPEKRRTSLPHP